MRNDYVSDVYLITMFVSSSYGNAKLISLINLNVKYKKNTAQVVIT
jgi:hypothetical protein